MKSKARREEIKPNEEEEELSDCPWKDCNSCFSFSHPPVRKYLEWVAINQAIIEKRGAEEAKQPAANRR